MRTLVLILGFLALGCGPAHPGAPIVLLPPLGQEATTALGNRVVFDASLDAHPDWRDQTVALIDSCEAANPSPRYLGLTFVVVPDAVKFASPAGTPFGAVVSSAESYYDPSIATVYLSWSLAGPVGQLALDSFAVGNVEYELANVRCCCESGAGP